MSAVLTQANVFKSLTSSSASSMLELTTMTRNKQQSASSYSTSPAAAVTPKVSILDVCHRKIRLFSGAPVAFLGGLVAKARRKDKEASAPGADDPKLYLEEAVLERKHPDLDLRLLVELPAGLDYNEWLASHTISFFDHINLIYGTISEFCTMSGCPDMTGPGLRTYLWFDEKGKKTKVAAPQYIDYVMTFTQKTINDESIFPTKYANEFPSSFESLVKKILRLLFHVVAHMYHSHFKEIVLLNLHAHLNSVFAHLILFNERFRLIEDKETEILQDLVTALRVHAGSEQDSSAAAAAASSSTSKENNNFLSAESDNKSAVSEENSACSSSSSRDVNSTPTRLQQQQQQEQHVVAQSSSQGDGGGGASAVVSG